MGYVFYRVQKAGRWSGRLEPGFSRSGRWHSGGRPVVYLAESPALATLEWLKSKMAVGLIEAELSQAALIMVSVTLELDVVPTVAVADLPVDWQTIPNIFSEYTQSLGNAWLDGRTSATLRVPSATLPFGMGWNVLLNPAHPKYPLRPLSVTTVPFSLAYYLGFPEAAAMSVTPPAAPPTAPLPA